MSRFFQRNLKRHYPIIQSGKGVWLTDADRYTYLDGCGGAIVSNIGHGVPEINQAITEQLSRVAFAHTSQFVSQAGLDLADILVALAPKSFAAGRVYFTSGGTESVETALKMARGYFLEKGQPSRKTIISRWQSYHGSTIGALSATGHPARRQPYLPMLKDEPHIDPVYPYRCSCGTADSCTSDACAIKLANQLESAIVAAGPETVLAFLAEPIVGAALGAAVPAQSYWSRIREICTKYGVLLIADEVMVGLGRCGRALALDLWNVSADIIVLGKGLSAGYIPLGAVMASSEVARAFEQGSGVFEHGFTYSGHPLACAAGLAVQQYVVKHDLIQRVAAKEKQFFDIMNSLRKFPVVGDIRGKGFLAGVELVANQKTKDPFPTGLRVSQVVAKEAVKAGLLIYPSSGSIDGTLGDHFMVAPAFNIQDEELEELSKRLEAALTAASRQLKVLVTEYA
jgi:adenosylmethionine-8-amino-7-oxononanoate aminotransferase